MLFRRSFRLFAPVVDPTAQVLLQCGALKEYDHVAAVWKQWYQSSGSSVLPPTAAEPQLADDGTIRDSRPPFCPVVNTMCQLLDAHAHELEKRVGYGSFHLFRQEALKRMYRPAAELRTPDCPAENDPFMIETDDCFTIQPNATDVDIDSSPFIQSLLVPLSVYDEYKVLLKKVIDRLDAAGITYWVTGGTLLGCVRHQGMIPWDDDVDLCVLAESDAHLRSVFNFPSGIEFSPMFGYKIYSDNSEKALPKDRHCCRFGIFIDLFTMRRRVESDNRIEQSRPMARETWPKEVWSDIELFPLREYDFGGVTVKGPAHAEPYLDKMYPGWKEKGIIPQEHHGRSLQKPVVLPLWQTKRYDARTAAHNYI